MNRILTMVLAGGAGSRLAPLTNRRCKPMMPFAGKYRLVDFPLSNCINSGLRRIFVLTQHNPLSLHRHIRQAWTILSTEIGEFIEILPPMRRLRNTWYLGTADAIYQNIARSARGTF
jgi:glucose-1-phosphate adenylyltransferase